MYGIVLTQGKRNDMARLLNAALLRQDWPLIRTSLHPRLRRQCERQFALGPSLAAEAADPHGGATDLPHGGSTTDPYGGTRARPSESQT